ncbi:MAG: exopolysaccharide biosynthesis protein [Rhodothermales bacterium]
MARPVPPIASEDHPSSSAGDQEPTNVEEVLDRVDAAADREDPVTVGSILDTIGTRSFGPIILLAGLIILAPLIGDIPGVPTIMASLIVLTTVQLLFHRENVWLPEWLLSRSVEREKLLKGVRWLRKPARFVDRFTGPRLQVFVTDRAVYAIAIACLLIAAVTPAMELVPFSANGAGLALTTFGLALTAKDGLLALTAFAVTGLTIGFVAYNLL